MSKSIAQLIAAGERASKRPATPKKKKASKKKTSKKRASKPRKPKPTGGATIVMSARELARLRKAAQTEIFGRPVRKKPKAKPKPKPRAAKKKAKKKVAKKPKGPKPGSPAWIKKMALAREKAAKKKKRSR